MKQLLRFSILLLAILMPALATAYDFEVDGIFYNINGNEATVTYNGLYDYSGSVTIPATVTCNGTTYLVTSIGKFAFYNCSSLTSVTIPNSVTSIGVSAFDSCSGLMSVSIPNSVTFIGNGAFSYCSGLTSVTISNSVTSIGDEVFSGCSGLISITIPNSVTSIGNWAFNECIGLTSVTIPNSVIYIGEGAFRYCSSLMSVTIPNSVTTIGDSAFDHCSGLMSVTIPNSVTSIKDDAFHACLSLKDMYSYIANPTAVQMSSYAFYDMSADYSGRTLHVLQGTGDIYRADAHWYPYFGRIVDDLIPETLRGDVNGDRGVNIADVNAIINIILSGNGNNAAADVNGDGAINIADVNAIIDIILSGAWN